VKPGTVVGADQVIGVALAEQVGAVARDPGRRGPLDRPLASKGSSTTTGASSSAIAASQTLQNGCSHVSTQRCSEYHTRVLTRARAEAPFQDASAEAVELNRAKLPSVPGSRTGH
jgi:hypothetical protein